MRQALSTPSYMKQGIRYKAEGIRYKAEGIRYKAYEAGSQYPSLYVAGSVYLSPIGHD